MNKIKNEQNLTHSFSIKHPNLVTPLASIYPNKADGYS